MSAWAIHVLPILLGTNIRRNDAIFLVTQDSNGMLEEVIQTLTRNGNGSLEVYYPGPRSRLNFEAMAEVCSDLSGQLRPMRQDFSCILCIGLAARLSSTSLHTFLGSWSELIRDGAQPIVVLELFRRNEEHWRDVARRYRPVFEMCGFALVRVNGWRGHLAPEDNMRAVVNDARNLRNQLRTHSPTISRNSYRVARTRLQARQMRLQSYALMYRSHQIDNHTLNDTWVHDRLIRHGDRLFATLCPLVE